MSGECIGGRDCVPATAGRWCRVCFRSMPEPLPQRDPPDGLQGATFIRCGGTDDAGRACGLVYQHRGPCIAQRFEPTRELPGEVIDCSAPGLLVHLPARFCALVLSWAEVLEYVRCQTPGNVSVSLQFRPDVLKLHFGGVAGDKRFGMDLLVPRQSYELDADFVWQRQITRAAYSVAESIAAEGDPRNHGNED